MLLGCLVALLVFVLFLLLPAIKKQGELEAKIKETRTRLEDLKQLQALEASLASRLNALKTLDTPLTVTKEPLAAQNAMQVPGIIQHLAKSSGATVKEMQPEFLMQANNTQLLKLDGKVLGQLNSHRVFLMSLLQLPYLEHINTITLEPSGEELELRVVFTVVLK